MKVALGLGRCHLVAPAAVVSGFLPLELIGDLRDVEGDAVEGIVPVPATLDDRREAQPAA